MRGRRGRHVDLVLLRDDGEGDVLERRAGIEGAARVHPPDQLDRPDWEGRRDGVVHLERDARSGRGIDTDNFRSHR